MSGHGIGCCRYLSLALLVWAGVDAPAVRTCLAQDPATSGPEPSRRTGGPLEKRVGSPYVELDSWIYPVLDRMAALGYMHFEFSDMRPWTRIECARMTQEAGKALDVDLSVPPEAQLLYEALRKEFQRELDTLSGTQTGPSIRLESLYTGVTEISGLPLNDSYHFGQTIINNYGRPYQEGFNGYDGLSGYAVAGRFAIYMRGEFQHAPSAPAYPLSAREAIAAADLTPLEPATPSASVDRFRLLDAYAAGNLAGWDLTIGKQSLWWAPNAGGALLFSDNAEPIDMVRVSRTAPFELPWIFRWLGPMKWDLFAGKLAGNLYPPRPFIHGEKIGFKPTENLELSFSRTGEFGGEGRALTLGAIIRTYTSFESSYEYPASQNPGERNGGFDFSYRIPGVRNWLTVYGDALSRDDPSPLDAPRRAAMNLGLYVARIPHVPQLDFRVEAVNTNTVSSPNRTGKFVYWENFYRDLYTNNNNLIGDWIGREGTGLQAWSRYWFNARNNIQFGYRHAVVAGQFIPYGETLNDASVSMNWWLHDQLQFSALLQYERWFAPILASSPRTNWTSSIEITFWPVVPH